MRASLLLVVPLVALAVATGDPARAAGPTASECLTASNTSLELRSAHKLRQVRARLLTCVSASCPAEIREECSRRMDQLTASIPTIVFAVKDGAGRELSAVKVTMDGEVVADHLDGSSLTLDPGAHRFTFEASGQPPVTETLILHEGEKGRRESVVLPSPPPAPVTVSPTIPVAAGPSSQAAPASAPEDGGHLRRALGLVVGSAGLVGLVVGGVFGGLTFASWGNANNECPSHAGCSTQATNDHDNAVTFGTISTVGFIAGGVLLAGGLTLYFTAPRGPSPGVGLQVAPGGLDVTGTF